MAKVAAYGAQLFRGTSGGGTAYAQMVSLSGPTLSADTIDVTTHASTNAWEEVVVGILRSGEMGMDIVYDPANATHKNAGNGLLADFLGRASTTFTIVFPDVGNTEWTFAAYVTGFDPSMPHDDALTAAVTFKLTGDITLV
jgi:predicted secreted protein